MRLGALAGAARPGLEAAPAAARPDRDGHARHPPGPRGHPDAEPRRAARRHRPAPGRRRRGAGGARRLSPRHGPPRDRLEAVGPPHQADRQGISHRAQQPYRDGDRLRPGDVRADRRRAARRPLGLRRLAHRLRRAEGRRPGRHVRLRQPAPRPLAADRRPARLRHAAADRRRHRIFGQRDQLHAGDGDPRPAISPAAR